MRRARRRYRRSLRPLRNLLLITSLLYAGSLWGAFQPHTHSTSPSQRTVATSNARISQNFN